MNSSFKKEEAIPISDEDFKYLTTKFFSAQNVYLREQHLKQLKQVAIDIAPGKDFLERHSSVKYSPPQPKSSSQDSEYFNEEQQKFFEESCQPFSFTPEEESFFTKIANGDAADVLLIENSLLGVTGL